MESCGLIFCRVEWEKIPGVKGSQVHCTLELRDCESGLNGVLIRKARALVPTCQDGVGFFTERRLLRQGRSMTESEWVVRRESVLCPKSSQKDNYCPKELNH